MTLLFAPMPKETETRLKKKKAKNKQIKKKKQNNETKLKTNFVAKWLTDVLNEQVLRIGMGTY